MAKEPVNIGDSTFSPSRRKRGTVIALAWVGQRDTKWFTPLTVSAVTSVRKVTAFYQALQAIPRL